MEIQHLNGIGQRPRGTILFRGVDDLYQQPNGVYSSAGLRGLLGLGELEKIKIGNKLYDQAQIQDKTLIAASPTKTYINKAGKGTIEYKTIPAGQPIGVVWTVLTPKQSWDGRAWVMFENSATNAIVDGAKFYYVPNELVTDTGLKDQGVKTVDEQVKEAEDEKLKDESPVEYYLKKYAVKALLIVGGIVIVGGIAREVVRASITRKRSDPEPAKPAEDKPLEGVKKRTIKTIKV